MSLLLGNDVAETPSLTAFGEILRRLYSSARMVDLDELRQQAAHLLEKQLPFDGALLGAATQLDGYMQVHDETIYGLPADMARKVNLAGVHNIAGLRAIEQPGRAWRFKYKELQAYPRMEKLLSQVDMSQIIVIATVHPVSRLVNITSFARRENNPAFSLCDARWLELLAPHLETMFEMSRLGSINRRRLAIAEGSWLMAATDIKGVLHVVEPGFDQRLRLEWPDWHGPFLPSVLINALAQGKTGFKGTKINIGIEWLNKQAIVRIGLRSALDMLTEREKVVARQYAQGCSYKQVAQMLNMAPATVRHHLRSIYEKLEIHDKAQLVMRLGIESPSKKGEYESSIDSPIRRK